VPKARVRIVSGNTSARKVIEISGLSKPEILHRLAHPAR
jgi:uncharacterized protein YggU (UPF0235/DUF167 family)